MKHRFLLMAGLGGIALSAAACPAVTNTSIFDGSGGDGGAGGAGHASSSQSSGQGMGGGVLFDAGNGGDSGSPADCSDAAKLIYVVGIGNELYSFSPPTLTFKQIGIINCPLGGGFATPFSMAVDRSGKAWVLFNDGRIFNVDTTTAACTATAFVPNQVPNFYTFGMGFVSDAPGSAAETLYVGSYVGVGIGKIDVKSLKLTQIGTYDTLSGPAEITGTGDARLFGFFLSTPTVVAELDKTNSHIISTASQPTVNIGSGWAFAFWGGDFYLFTAPLGSSQVDKYSPLTKTTTTVKSNLGFTIVGAGVSTCAPTMPPK